MPPVNSQRDHNAIYYRNFTVPFEIVQFSNPPAGRVERSEGRGQC
jgi:hypothetical protein